MRTATIRRTAGAVVLVMALSCCAVAKGKIAGTAGGNEREAVVYSAKNGLEAWTITGPDGSYEFSVEPGEYMMSCGGRLVPYVRVRDGLTTWVNYADTPDIEMQSELWTPTHRSFGQTYTATGAAFNGVGFWMPSGDTKLKLTLREDGPQGKLLGEVTTEDSKNWITGVGMGDKSCPTVPGKVYYMELSSTEDKGWCIATPKVPDPYPGGIAYYDGAPHPESDLGVSIWESHPGPVTIAGAGADQHFIKEGPGSGSCTVAGQTFVAAHGKNIISAGANCGFGGGIQDFIFSIYEGGPGGKLVCSKLTRMVSDWGTTAYFLPDEVLLKPGERYYFEYKRVDGEPFYSYLSADVYPDGEAYRDGKKVEGGFDQLFDIVGELEPEGITFPYNVKLSNVTSDSARVSWETGTKADGILEYGDSQAMKLSLTANTEPDVNHAVTLTGLKPGTVYYYRVTSFTGKAGAARAYGRTSSFMTEPAGKDAPRFDSPEQVSPVAAPGAGSVKLANGSFEDGLAGWKRLSWATPKKYEEATKEYPIGNGPFGVVTSNCDGYKPHSGRLMYGWSHLGVDDPNPILPREDWKHEVIYQSIPVTPGREYVLKAWLLTGDRDSGWGRDSRIRLEVDANASGAIARTGDQHDELTATQWFATLNEWQPVSLRFTAQSDTAAIGVHILQWWAMEADYLYVDDVTVEEL